MTETPRHSVSVAGAVFNRAGDRILLIQRRDNRHWEPPGGVLELAETIEDGLRREIQEETGVEVSVDRLTGVYKNMPQGIVALVFRCTTESKPATQTPEATNVAWIATEDIDKFTEPVYATRLLDALETSSTPQVRDHDGTEFI